MKQQNFPIWIVLIICYPFFAASCINQQNQAIEEIAAKTLSPEEVVSRGEYLVGITGCNDCHSPKRMGSNGPELIPELMLSGYPSDRPIIDFKDSLTQVGFSMFYPDLTAAIGPWGMSFAGNLTPDPTGIGSWTEDQFSRAITQGKFKGLEKGRMLLPPMPWQNYRNLTKEDLHAMFMYLQSIKPVSNTVPAPIPPNMM